MAVTVNYPARRGEETTVMSGLVDDLSCGAAQVEQRIKGVVIGVILGAVGTGVLVYLYGGAVLPMLKK